MCISTLDVSITEYFIIIQFSKLYILSFFLIATDFPRRRYSYSKSDLFHCTHILKITPCISQSSKMCIYSSDNQNKAAPLRLLPTRLRKKRCEEVF